VVRFTACFCCYVVNGRINFQLRFSPDVYLAVLVVSAVLVEVSKLKHYNVKMQGFCVLQS